MKLLLENWRKFTTEEEEIDEGVGTAALGAALALGGAGKGDVQQYDTDTSSGDQTTQQVDAEKQAEGELQKNEDGSYSMEYSNPATKGMAMSTSCPCLLVVQCRPDISASSSFSLLGSASCFDHCGHSPTSL